MQWGGSKPLIPFFLTGRAYQLHDVAQTLNKPRPHLARRPLWVTAASGTVALAVAALQISCGGGSMMSEQSGGTGSSPQPQLQLVQLSSDAFTNPDSQHATEVEPTMFASGSTIVTAFQVGRTFGGGSSDIGFATSLDEGATWTNGLLPGITVHESGTYNAVSDPAVVFDKAHARWIIVSLAIGRSIQVVVSGSADAKTWGNPVIVSGTPNADKPWITCDNTSASPYFGHCYVEWDDPNSNGLIWMSTSNDGGLTWATAVNTADSAAGVGGQPLVQPIGNVIMPILNGDGTKIIAFTSTNGGRGWNATVTVATITDHAVAGNMRTTTLPSAAIDAAGTAYVVWQDCRFRVACASNDLVLSTSQDGNTWSVPVRIPIDATSSTVDHFIPGLSSDSATAGATAHLSLTYYFYSDTNCLTATCALNAGFVSSVDGGNSWSTPTMLAGPMSLSWLPNTSSGVMVGDYVASAYSNGKAYPVLAVAQANSGSQFSQAIYTTAAPVAAARLGQARTAVSHLEPVLSTRSDHPAQRFEDLDRDLYPKKPPRK